MCIYTGSVVQIRLSAFTKVEDDVKTLCRYTSPQCVCPLIAVSDSTLIPELPILSIPSLLWSSAVPTPCHHLTSTPSCAPVHNPLFSSSVSEPFPSVPCQTSCVFNLPLPVCLCFFVVLVPFCSASLLLNPAFDHPH